MRLRPRMGAAAAIRRIAIAAIALGGCASPLGCRSDAAPAQDHDHLHHQPAMTVGYLEIVTPNVDATVALYEGLHGLSFGPPQEVLGGARTATMPDDMLVAIRAPLAAHEGPIVRAYLAVDDIQQAVKTAEERGATIAYPPTQQGDFGTFAIVIQDDVQHGLWQP